VDQWLVNEHGTEQPSMRPGSGAEQPDHGAMNFTDTPPPSAIAPATKEAQVEPD
jgi:hypothetical protein